VIHHGRDGSCGRLFEKVNKGGQCENPALAVEGVALKE
jgi:hypothetical protein